MKHVHLEQSPREGLGEGYEECAFPIESHAKSDVDVRKQY
jgi:hypothetical protein